MSMAWLRNSLRHRMLEAKLAAKKNRSVHTSGPMFDARQTLARAYDEAAAVYARFLAEVPVDTVRTPGTPPEGGTQ